MVTTEKNVAEVGKEMCQNKVVKKVSFTGSTPVAKLIAGLAATTLKKCMLPRTTFDDGMLTNGTQGVHRGRRQRSVHCVRRCRYFSSCRRPVAPSDFLYGHTSEVLTQAPLHANSVAAAKLACVLTASSFNRVSMPSSHRGLPRKWLLSISATVWIPKRMFSRKCWDE